MIAFLALACLPANQIDKENGAAENDSVQADPETGVMAGITAVHNEIRRAHGVNDLTWDAQMVQLSADWIDELDANNNCVMEHNWDSPYGENLFWANYETTNRDVVESWASEEEFYDYATDSCDPGEQCGHYTQVVWSETLVVGCAMKACSNGNGWIWMCNYDPAGNMVGQRPY